MRRCDGEWMEMVRKSCVDLAEMREVIKLQTVPCILLEANRYSSTRCEI